MNYNVWFVVEDSSVSLYLLIPQYGYLAPWLVSTDLGTFVIIIIIIIIIIIMKSKCNFRSKFRNTKKESINTSSFKVHFCIG